VLVAGVALPNGPCRIMSKAGKFALGVQDGSTDRGRATVIANASDSAGDQQWTFNHLGDGWFEIVNKNSGQFLAASEGKKDAGAGIIQFEQTGGDDQLWKLEADNGKFVRIVNRNSGLCLTAPAGAKPALNTPLTQQPFKKQDGQLWRVEAAMPAGR
jgi:hypothetical protein